MSFLTTVEAEASAVETAVVDGLKAAVNYVDNVAVTEFGPELVAAIKGALAVFDQTVLASLITANTPPAPPSA